MSNCSALSQATVSGAVLVLAGMPRCGGRRYKCAADVILCNDGQLELERTFEAEIKFFLFLQPCRLV